MKKFVLNIDNEEKEVTIYDVLKLVHDRYDWRNILDQLLDVDIINVLDFDDEQDKIFRLGYLIGEHEGASNPYCS